MKAFMGIDPGMSGGLVCIQEDGEVDAIGMPATEKDIWSWFDCNDVGCGDTFAMIEKVGGFIKGNPRTGSSMFKFGLSVGFLRGCLTAAAIPFEEVPPQRWQKALGVKPRGANETPTHWKNRLKARAQQLFPEAKVTLYTADAFLIAEYCRRTREGVFRG
jgi:hypothetical protein